MKICAKEARRLKSKIEFRRLMEKMKKWFLDFLAQYEVYGYLKKWWWIWQKNLQGWERRSSGKFTILLVFLRKRRRWAFSLFKQIRFRPGIHQPFRGFFGLIYPTKRIFEPTVLLLKKAARCQPFLAVVRCLFHNHLRLKRSSLLNVYLNYKFEFSLLTSHLSFSLFNMKTNLHLVSQYRRETYICKRSKMSIRQRLRFVKKSCAVL